MTTDQPKQKKIKLWQFLFPLLLQLALILSVPAHSFYTYTTGKTVILQTQPVDPYELLRGYSQTLSYTISQTNNLKELKGWQEVYNQVNQPQYYYDLPDNTTIYLTLEEPKKLNQKPPLPWQPIAISLTYPKEIKSNQIILKGVTQYNMIQYGLERYYFPESRREEINNKINEIQLQNNQKFVVEIKVDTQGNAIPISLWVGDQNYHF